MEIRVPTIREPEVDYTDLLNQSRYTRGRVRAHIDRDIGKRQAAMSRLRVDSSPRNLCSHLAEAEGRRARGRSFPTQASTRCVGSFYGGAATICFLCLRPGYAYKTFTSISAS